MKYYFNCDKWGSCFSVPASVAQKHLKLCDPVYLKVLIFALSQNDHELDSSLIADACGVSEKIVDDAVKYWQTNGVLVSDRNSAQPAVQNQQVGAVKAFDPTGSSVSKKLAIRYTNAEILEKTRSDKQLSQLLNEIQSVFGKTINSTEQGELIALYEYYGFDAASILLTAQYCVSLDKTRVAYLATVKKSWYEQEILTYQQIEREIIRVSAVKKYESRCLSAFGITSKPTPTQLEYIRAWKDMGFTIEMLEIAYNKCMDNINKLNFKYINTILTDWASNSITTPTQVNAEDSKFKGRKKAASTAEKTSYDLDEFERFAKDFDLSRAKKNN